MSKSKTPPAERLAYSIQEFCTLVGLSRSGFYNLPADQRPREIRVGKRRLIPAAAAREWLSREVAA